MTFLSQFPQDNVAAGAQLKAMEERISKLREAGLDADPDVSERENGIIWPGSHPTYFVFQVLSLAAKLASKLSISLTVAADARPPIKSSRHEIHPERGNTR